MNCPKCGEILNERAQFCMMCGTKIEQKLVCSNCGEELDKRAKFCMICGTAVAKNTSTSSNPVNKTTKSSNSAAIVLKSAGKEEYKGNLELENVIIADGVSEIGVSAFHGCENLKSVTIPDSVAKIGAYAFRDCKNLKSIVIPEGVTEIEMDTFFNCASLTKITIPDSVTKIGYSSLSCCSSLKSITIPDSVTEIGLYAFADCPNLTDVKIPDSITKISGSAFHASDNVVLPDFKRYGLFYRRKGCDLDDKTAVEIAKKNGVEVQKCPYSYISTEDESYFFLDTSVVIEIDGKYENEELDDQIKYQYFNINSDCRRYVCCTADHKYGFIYSNTEGNYNCYGSSTNFYQIVNGVETKLNLGYGMTFFIASMVVLGDYLLVTEIDHDLLRSNYEVEGPGGWGGGTLSDYQRNPKLHVYSFKEDKVIASVPDIAFSPYYKRENNTYIITFSEKECSNGKKEVIRDTYKVSSIEKLIDAIIEEGKK